MQKASGMILAIIIMVFFCVPFVYAESDKLEQCEKIINQMLYYNEHIDHKIKAAELDAEQKYSDYEDIRCLARHGEVEAAFYWDNRSRLIKEMLQQDLKPEDHKVHLYLIQAFHKAHPEAQDMCK
ncbi:MAG: hypothetical protein K9M82_06825 [Deltaproteobacteria bacterium]|nr:hypothetical protein [Deltaproteobacteria bacterium]